MPESGAYPHDLRGGHFHLVGYGHRDVYLSVPAYKVMMVTGIGVTILNLNPLIKLDGYYLLSELINETGLKEESTVYVSSWVRKHIFRLPAEVAYVPRHRRVLYIVYSVLSGVYSYLLIAVVVVFVYHILINYTPEWAWLPALLLGLRLFSRGSSCWSDS